MGDEEVKRLRHKFEGMMAALFQQKGASLDISVLASDEAQGFIQEHASLLDSSFQKVEMTDAMRSRLTRSDYIFSGLKAFHELNEAFPSLLDENGDRKPFERFLNDVQTIDETYNRHYLRAEYNFIHASAEMAAKWEGFMQDGDRYNLQYRTQRDDRVRPEHAALDGTTLPPSDPFWEEYYPPNGWNCFIEGTPVLTQSGWRSIESIRKGDSVIGGSGKLRKVIGTHAKLVDDELVGIIAKGTQTTCTKNHRFCTPHGWVSAESLKPGDIVIQAGETSALHLLVHAIKNARALLRYSLMACVGKRKAVAPLAVDDEIERGYEKIDHVASDELALLKRETGREQVRTHDSLTFAQRSTERAHAFRTKRPSGERMMQRLRLYVMAKKGRAGFKLFSYAADKIAVFLRLSLTRMKPLLGKLMVSHSKALARLRPSFRIADPLRPHCVTAMPDRNAAAPHDTADGSAVHMPAAGKPPKAALFFEVPKFRGIDNIHAFNGFHSFFDFLRYTFFHNRYVLIERKVTTKKRETTVYNLSVFKDESYIVPVGITHNCRCTVVQVRRSKYPATPHDEAMARGEEALQRDTKGIFRFNPGKEQKTMPDYNPYTIKRCRDCDVAKGKAKLAFVPENELCEACRMVHQLERGRIDEDISRLKIATAKKSLVNWYKDKLPTVSIGKFTAKRFEVTATDGTNIVVKRSFYDETISKYQDDPMYPLKLEYAKKAHELIKEAHLVNPSEVSVDHPGASFKVYEIIDNCYRVEMKVKCNRDGNYMHILRVYKK